MQPIHVHSNAVIQSYSYKRYEQQKNIGVLQPPCTNVVLTDYFHHFHLLKNQYPARKIVSLESNSLWRLSRRNQNKTDAHRTIYHWDYKSGLLNDRYDKIFNCICLYVVGPTVSIAEYAIEIIECEFCVTLPSFVVHSRV